MFETNDLATIMLDTFCKSFLLFLIVLVLIFAMRTFSRKASNVHACLLYTSPSPRDRTRSRMPSSA